MECTSHFVAAVADCIQTSAAVAVEMVVRPAKWVQSHSRTAAAAAGHSARSSTVRMEAEQGVWQHQEEEEVEAVSDFVEETDQSWKRNRRKLFAVAASFLSNSAAVKIESAKEIPTEAVQGSALCVCSRET